MSADRIALVMSRLATARASLDEAMEGPADVKAYRDSTILSFTFVYELTWNALKEGLALVGIIARNPRETFQHAYQQRWIDNEQFWVDMLQDHNLIVHTYNAELSLEIYQRIRDNYASEFRRVYSFLRDKFPDASAG